MEAKHNAEIWIADENDLCQNWSLCPKTSTKGVSHGGMEKWGDVIQGVQSFSYAGWYVLEM